jgi:hypothetical protein
MIIESEVRVAELEWAATTAVCSLVWNRFIAGRVPIRPES